MADFISVKLLINRYDCESKVSVDDFPKDLTIGDLKCKLFSADIAKDCNIRVIHRGKIVKDIFSLNKLKQVDELQLVLTVFITKPTQNNYNNKQESGGNVWKWSTTVWLLMLATFWCYKLKFVESFKNFSVMVLYIATFLCCHTVFARFITNSNINRTN